MREVTPQEQAEKMVEKFLPYAYNQNPHSDGVSVSEPVRVKNAIECALIAVREILDMLDNWKDYRPNKSIRYWKEVKTEIKNYGNIKESRQGK